MTYYDKYGRPMRMPHAKRRSLEARRRAERPPKCYEVLHYKKIIEYSATGLAVLVRFGEDRLANLPLSAIKGGAGAAVPGSANGKIAVELWAIEKKGLWEFQADD